MFEYIVVKFMHSCFYGHNNIIFKKHIVNQIPNHTHDTSNLFFEKQIVKVKVMLKFLDLMFRQFVENKIIVFK